MKGRVFVPGIVALIGCACAGPAIAQVAWEAGFKGGVSATSLKGDDALESTDFGLAAGAGLAIAASPSLHIVMDGRFNFGLSKIPKSGEDIKNSGFAFMAGLSFPLGGGGAPR